MAAQPQQVTPHHLRLLAFALALYFALASWKAATMYIWSNEAWFASPALTLLQKGYLGTTILESKGTWLAGIDRHTYWQPPLHLLLQAVWYKLFGFGLFSLRSISIVCGAATLLAWCLIVWKLSGQPAIALLTMAIAGADPRFLTFAALGRSDMMCAAFGSLGWAAYLRLRETSIRRAIVTASVLAAASCLTHPCGVLYAAGLILMMLYYDRRRIGFAELALAATPYAAGLAMWGIYILQAPSEFFSQFTGNVSGIAGEFTSARRWSNLSSPLGALKRELLLRYGANYGWYETALLDRIGVFAVAIYGIAVAGCALTAPLRARYRVLLMLGALDYMIMAMFDGLKGSAYLAHTIPLMAAMLAVFVYYVYGTRPIPRWALILTLACFTAVQIGGFARELSNQPVRWDYEAAVDFVRRTAAPPPIIAGGEFAFALGFDSQMVDDFRLGYYSGRRPELIVANRIYSGWMEQSATRYPDVHAYIERLLKTEYRIAFRNQNYTIYKRTGL